MVIYAVSNFLTLDNKLVRFLNVTQPLNYVRLSLFRQVLDLRHLDRSLGSICKQPDLEKFKSKNERSRVIIYAPDQQFVCAMVRVSDHTHYILNISILQYCYVLTYGSIDCEGQ